jgi:hypothetical protein
MPARLRGKRMRPDRGPGSQGDPGDRECRGRGESRNGGGVSNHLPDPPESARSRSGRDAGERRRAGNQGIALLASGVAALSLFDVSNALTTT